MFPLSAQWINDHLTRTLLFLLGNVGIIFYWKHAIGFLANSPGVWPLHLSVKNSVPSDVMLYWLTLYQPRIIILQVIVMGNLLLMLSVINQSHVYNWNIMYENKMSCWSSYDEPVYFTKIDYKLFWLFSNISRMESDISYMKCLKDFQIYNFKAAGWWHTRISQIVGSGKFQHFICHALKSVLWGLAGFHQPFWIASSGSQKWYGIIHQIHALYIQDSHTKG